MALESVLSQEMIQRLGWTLLHFVWQATAVALLLAILLAALRKATASVHYIMACTALGLIVLLPLVTMSLVPVSEPQPIARIEAPPAPVILPMRPTIEETSLARVVEVEEPVQAKSTEVAPKVLWKQRTTEKLELSLPYLVTGWLIGVFGLSLWHLGGWAQLQRLKRHMIKPVDATLRATLNELAEKLRVHRAVRLVESALVQVPTVVGWLRPVILMPASALTGLATEQLEALLAHELAHIRRCDYLVNILQTIVETLGFYHPAVWWVSHKIRLERENCCDDIAVGICGDRVRYARALTSMEVIRTRRNELAVAATGGNLFGRICRLLGKGSSDNSRAGWIPSVITILLIAIIAVPTSIALNSNVRIMDRKESIESNKVILKLVDPNSQPVAGARVGTSTEWSDTTKNPPIWFLRDGGRTRATKVKSDKYGKVTLEAGDLFWSVPPTEQKAPIAAIDKGHFLAALQELSQEDLGKEVTLTLQPSCRVHGQVTAATARKHKWSPKTLTVYVDWREHRPCQYSSKEGRFEFVLPPGIYKVKVYAENPDEAVILPIQIKPGQRDLDLTNYLDGTSLLPTDEIEIPVQSEKGGIEGRIIDIQTGKGIVGVTLAAVPRDPLASEKQRVCTSGEAGIFSLSGPKSGEYQIRGDFPSLDVDILSGQCIRDVLIGVDRRDAVLALKETTAEQQSDVKISMGVRVIEMPADAMKEAFEPDESLSSELLVRNGYEIADRLLTLTDKRKDTKLIVNPQLLMINNGTASIMSGEHMMYISGYESAEDEPNKLTPKQKRLEAGWKYTFHAGILESGQKVRIELAALQQKLTFETRQHRPGYDYQIPSPPEIFVTEMTAKNGEPVAIGRLRRGETAFCLIVTPSVIMPEPQPESLLGKKLPEPAYMEVLKQIGKKQALICFWDMNQRPSRNMITGLAKRSKELQDKGIFPVLMHTSLVEPAKLKEWLDNREILFSYYSRTEATSAQELFRWGVRAQPWLILTDEEGIVQAEGFSLEQLDEKLQESASEASVKGERTRTKASATGSAPVPVLSKSSIPTNQDKIHIQVDCLVAEIEPSAEMDRKTIIAIENLLGFIRPEPAELLKQAVQATAKVEDTIDGDKHVTQEQLKTLMKLLADRGFMKILMSPTLQVTELQTAQIKTAESSLEVTVKGIKDDIIFLHVKADLDSQIVPEGEGKKSIISRRSFANTVLLSPGQSKIVGGMVQPTTKVDSNTKSSQAPAKEIACIVSANIITPIDDAKQPNENTAQNEYEVVQLRYVDAEQAAERLNQALKQMQGTELQTNVLIQPLEKARQIIIFGRKEVREIVKKLIAQLDTPDSLLEIRVFQLKYTDPALIKERIEGSYEHPANEPKEMVRVTSSPAMKQVTVIASPENMSRIAKQIAEWDIFQVFKPRIIKLQNSDSAQMAKLLTTLFAEEGGEGVNIRDVILGEDAEEKYNIVGPLSGHFTFEEVPGTNRIIVISNLPTAYEAVVSWILELDQQKMASKDVKQVREWMARLARFDRQVKESAERLKCIGRAMLMDANDHDGKYPEGMKLHELREYLKTEEFAWSQQYEYLAGGRSTADRPDLVIYHDADLIKFGKGTNVLFNDGHVEFASPERLNDLNINETSILIETRILTAGDAFMKHVGLDPNSPASSEGWSDYFVQSSIDSTSFIIDPLHADLLIKTAATHKDAAMLAAPQICAADGRPAMIQIRDSSPYPLMPPDNEPNYPSGKPESKTESIELGTFIRLVPDALPDGKTVDLEFEWEYRRLLGVKKHTGPDQKTQMVPQIAIDSIKTFCPVPDGKTLLIAGKRIAEPKKKEPRKPGLADLPLVGWLFSSPTKTEETRNLLILIKPVINPPQRTNAQQQPEPPPPFDPDDPLIKKLEEKLRD